MVSVHAGFISIKRFSCELLGVLVFIFVLASPDSLYQKDARENEQDRNNWSRQIDLYIEKVRKACTDEIPSSELEALLIEAVGLKLKRPDFIDSSTERAKMETEKLKAATELLVRWLDYRVIRDAGELMKAKSKLKYLMEGPSLFPILNRSFLDGKIAAIQRTRETPETTPNRPHAEVQKEIIKKLEAGNWDGKTVSGYAETLERSLNEEATRFSLKRSKVKYAIGYLGECLLALERNDVSKARSNFSLSDFGHIPVPSMKRMERKVVSELFPLFYPELEIPPLATGQPLSRYKIELLAEPHSAAETARQNRLNYWFGQSHWADKEPKWKKAADRQYSWLGSAQKALESQNFPKALYYFRSALFYAPDSGLATAQTYIESQIREIRESHPELFDPSGTTIAGRIALAEEHARELEAAFSKALQNN